MKAFTIFKYIWQRFLFPVPDAGEVFSFLFSVVPYDRHPAPIINALATVVGVDCCTCGNLLSICVFACNYICVLNYEEKMLCTHCVQLRPIYAATAGRDCCRRRFNINSSTHTQSTQPNPLTCHFHFSFFSNIPDSQPVPIHLTPATGQDSSAQINFIIFNT